MQLIRKALLLLAFGSTTALAATAIAAEPAKAIEKKEVPKDLVLKGDAQCTTCHDEADSPELLAIGKTRHGVRGDKRTPGCTSCHGDSEKHLGYKGKDKPPKPDRTFGRHSANSADQRNDACLSCHKGGNRLHWAGSTHQSNEVACSSCHQVHKGGDKVRDKATQGEVCYTCHKEQRAETRRVSTHPIQAGGIACSSCHNLHGSTGPKLLLKNSTNETCWTCHAEKRGPFLWEHPSASDDCMNCHTPHGSNHAPLLKTRQPYLCSSCHIAGGHSTTGIRSGNDLGSGVVVGGSSNATTSQTARAGTPNAAAQMIGKSCTNCHTEVHGSNHPSGARFAR